MDPADARFWLRGYIHQYLGFPDAVEDHVGYWPGDDPEFGEGEVVRYGSEGESGVMGI
jgi:hypothetical protein